MIRVEFRYRAKSVKNDYAMTSKIENSKLGDTKPCNGIVYGEVEKETKAKINAFIKEAESCMEDGCPVEVASNIQTFLKEKKSGTTGKSKKDTGTIPK